MPAETQTPELDVFVERHGKLFLFWPLTDAARNWVHTEVPEGARFFGAALVVEHGFAPDVTRAMTDDGLEVA
jgi:hypothetical protein